jgi:hypothetical protein
MDTAEAVSAVLPGEVPVRPDSTVVTAGVATFCSR